MSFVTVLMTLALFRTFSRSGIVAFGVAALVTAGYLIRRREAGGRRLVGVVYLTVLIGFVVAAVGTENLSARFGNGDAATLSRRLPIWHDTVGMIRDFPLTGSGVNTYHGAMLLYQTALPDVQVRHAHNDYLQIAAEGGVLLSIAVAAAMVTFIAAVRRRLARSSGSTYWIRLGAITGLIAIAVQSTLEFSLQMPGNVVLLVVLCGLALHHEKRSAHRSPAPVPAPVPSRPTLVRTR
jgi:O-antigen ligase